ncbi:MAG: agmatinase family protein [Phycisphaerales bacterium]|nr:agmatinase family protein [Phycisphaerales bacterium]
MSQPPFLNLEIDRANAGVVLLGVPFDATTSYRPGTAMGPAAILEASAQIDLEDTRLGRISDRGILMEPIEPWIAELSAAVRPDAEPMIETEGEPPFDESARDRVDAACERVRDHVRQKVADVLAEGRTPGVVGGEHGVSLGAIEASAAHAGEVGILQIDAHMDLREAYCGLRHSHASVMRNALTLVPGVTALAQVGIRDYCREEREFAQASRASLGKPVTTIFGEDIADAGGEPGRFLDLVERALHALPPTIYVSFDIDALEVYLCPNAGTPVPGGLSFQQAGAIIKAIIDCGKQVIGFDLVEVAPDPDRNVRSIDAIVGARVLYKLCALGA